MFGQLMLHSGELIASLLRRMFESHHSRIEVQATRRIRAIYLRRCNFSALVGRRLINIEAWLLYPTFCRFGRCFGLLINQ